MAFGDGTIKQQNVQQVQTTPASSVTPNPIVESSKNIVVPVAVDEELLKLLGLTLEQYLQLSDEQKSEVNNQINQIKNPADKTNFGIPGLSIEKTTTEAANDKLTSIENPVEVKAEVQNKENSIIKRDDTSKRTITEKDWKQMSPEQRAAYLRSITDEMLKDVPEDQKDAARQELLDNRIKQTRGFSDERWNNMSDERKARLRRNYMADFHMVIENGFTKEDLANLSYADKTKLEIQHGLMHKEKLFDKISEEITQNSVTFEAGGDIEDAMAIGLDLAQKQERISSSIEKSKKILENSSPELDARENTIGAALNAASQKADGTYDNLYTDFKNSIDGKKLTREERKQVFIDYVSKELYKVPEEKRAREFQNMIGSLNDEQPEYARYLLIAVGKDTKLLASLNFDDSDQEMKDALIDINQYFESNGTQDLSEDEAAAIARFQTKLADQRGDYFLPEVKDARAIMARDGHVMAMEEFSKTKNKDLQRTHVDAVNLAPTLAIRRQYAATVTNLKNDEIRSEQTSRVFEGISGEEQIETQKVIAQRARGDKFVLHGFNDALAEKIIEKDAQVPFAQNTMDATQYLSDTDAVEVQKGLADANASGVDAENQDDIYKIVMSSKFDEVQEYAASNIYKLDESVRDWASEYTKSLGKENLTDAIRTEPPAPDNSSDAASSVEQNYSSNEILSQDPVSPINFDDTPVETPQSEEQTVQMQEELKKIDLNSAEAAQKFVEIVDKYNVQFSNYLAGLSQGQRTKMIELYCKNASPAKIFTFLKDNLSFYQTILNSAGTKLNMYKDDIFKLLKGKESNTVALATELGIDIMEYAKTNKEEAPDLAILTKNTELARNILLNPGFYNYQPGSSVHQKLLELASGSKHNKKSDNSEMGNNLQIKA